MEKLQMVSHLSGDVTTVYEFDAIVPIPSSAKKSSRKKGKASKVGKSKVKPSKRRKRSKKKENSDFNAKPIIIGIALLLLIVGMVLLIIVLSGGSNSCTDEIPSMYDTTICERTADGRKCDFDVSVCTTGCLLGYEEDEYGCIRSCDCAKIGNFEGDIAHTPAYIKPITTAYEKSDHGDGVFRSALQHQIWDQYRIDNRTRIPYVLSAQSELTDRERILKEAVNTISMSTCVDFYPRSTQSDFLDFAIDGHSCRSYVGRLGGRQKIYTRKSCEFSGLFQHTLLHSLGFWHEQSRPDRDVYVTIDWDNVEEANKIYFSKREWLLVNGSQYDVDSVMHSDGYYFSSNSKATIYNKKTLAPITSQRKSLSSGDVSKINQLYKCNMTLTPSGSRSGDNWGQWGDWHECSSSCGRGNRVRLRECWSLDEEMRVYHGRCGEDFVEKEECETLPCFQRDWGSWSSCSVSCGAGTRHRASCCYPKEEFQEEICAQPSCDSANGNKWSSWDKWGSCSRSCGSGFQKRVRVCMDSDFNVLQVGDCPLVIPAGTDERPCSTDTCNIAISTWSDWGQWQSCSLSCGQGSQIRNRTCFPTPGCYGESSETTECNTAKCPSLGSWTDWGMWSDCCNTDKRQRSRTCYQQQNQIDRNCEEEPGSIDRVGRQWDYEDCLTQICSAPTSTATTTTTTQRPRGLIESLETTLLPEAFCVGGDRFIHNQVGEHDDAICIMLDGTISVRLGNADGIIEEHPELGGTSGLCVNLEPRQMLMADINGDRSMDLICHHAGQMYFLYSSPTQVFAGNPVVVAHPTTLFCPLEQGTLYLADINNDGKADFICNTSAEVNPFILNTLS